jgi:EAL domain-containing protein (putative c-di-GMP-specific phosphodiesterase class I)/GGDEF domain-containing protein
MQKFLKKALVFTIVTVLLTALGSSVIAVDFSKDNTGAHDSVFIAGNPDMYPLEYYDPALNKYRGVLPELYEKISEETGISFTYIYTSSQNKQEYLANNSQVDIVSAHLSIDGIKNLEEALKLEYTVNGKEYTAVVGFTSVCPEEVKTAIKGYISSMEKDQLASMTVSFVIGTGERHSVYYIECIVMAVIILVLAFLTVYFYKKLSNLKKNVLYSQQYDPQTGIYNAQFFLGMINTELSHQARTLYYATAICANHTELKKHYSDEEIAELQQYIARSLSQECGEAEFCAKDIETTFFLVFKETNREKAVNRLDILMKKLNMENGILKDEHKVKLRAGVYELSEKFESSDYIFNIAKEAFLSAEKEDELYFFATESLVIATTQKKSFQKKDMERILANGEILYYLQFIVDTDTGNIWGAEAMSRWEHPRDGLLMPGQYVELMQQSHTIYLLDYYMFEKTCIQLQKWRGTNNDSLHISCNFDRSTISDENFFDKLLSIASKYDIDRSKLIIEIPADTTGYDQYNIKHNSRLCAKAGFKVALDNFKCNTNTYATLTEFSAGYLKFDHSLIKMLESEIGKNTLKELISHANSMELSIIFEGVESLEQLEQAKELGLHYVQGFYFSHVIPYVEAERFLSGLKRKLSGDEASDSNEEIVLAFMPNSNDNTNTDTVEVISIIWSETAHKNKIYLYDPNGLQINDGDTVIVPTMNEKYGVEVTRKALVARGNHRVSASSIHRDLKKILGVVKN